jgi:hypothetical protein
MKAKALLLIALAAAAVHARQQQPPPQTTPADAPGVSVVKFSWDKERINWERDPFGGPVENFDEMRVRARNEKRIDDAKRGGSPDVDRIRREARADSAILQAARNNRGPARYGFRYKVSVRNEGAKAVREVDWDYVFNDAATHEEVGRHQFTSAERVGPGKRRDFSFFIPTPPALRVSAYDLGRRERDGLEESVVVVRILYEDGTEWRRQ